MNTWKCLEVLMPTDPTSLDDILHAIPPVDIDYEHDNEDEDPYDDEYDNFDELEDASLNPEIPNVIPENCLHHETGEILKNPIYVANIGWFESNDPRIKNDFMSFVLHYEHCKIIDDKKYNKFYTSVYSGINDFGQLSDKQYSLFPSSNFEFKRNTIIVADYDSERNYFVDSNVLKNKHFSLYYNEDLTTGMFFNRTQNERYVFKKHLKINGIKSDKSAMSFLDYVNEKKIPTTFFNTFGKKYQFGVEIETISGLMPAYLQKDLHYSSVHDGSLRQEDDNTAWGKEYVTSVLQGDLGLKNLKMICYELSKRCMVNKQCGVHVHLSGVNFNKENIVMMYWLYQRLQDEVYKMLPKSRRNNEYCRKLKPIAINIDNLNSVNRNFYIEKYYNDIILFVSKNNFPGREVNKKRDHPAGFKCGYDHSSSRYSWVNFVPSVFDTRGNKVYTIEFRPAPGSTSYLKIKNWLLICMALVDVVENHKQFLHKNRETVDLLSVLTEVYGQKAGILCKWVDERKQLFNVIPNNNDLSNEITDYETNELDEVFDLKKL